MTKIMHEYNIRGKTHTYHCRECKTQLQYTEDAGDASISGGYCRYHMERNEDQIFMRIHGAYIVEEGYPEDQFGPFTMDLFYQSSGETANG